MTTNERGLWTEQFPVSLSEFTAAFSTEEACRTYLARCRWPDGFRCPSCSHGEAYWLEARALWKCKACRRQVSVTAGTIMHRSQQPLVRWFLAAYLVATSSSGLSARQLQARLGLKRYETAWAMLRRLREAMAVPERDRLTGTVEVDEVSSVRLRGSGLLSAPPGEGPYVVGAAEVRGRGVGRVRLGLVPDLSAKSLVGFVQSTVAPGSSTVLTDDLLGYRPLQSRGYEHISVVPPGVTSAVRALPRIYRVFEEAEAWLSSTYQQVGEEHFAHYLDEYAFRFNRRRRPGAGFQALLGLVAERETPVLRTSQGGE